MKFKSTEHFELWDDGFDTLAAYAAKGERFGWLKSKVDWWKTRLICWQPGCARLKWPFPKQHPLYCRRCQDRKKLFYAHNPNIRPGDGVRI